MKIKDNSIPIYLQISNKIQSEIIAKQIKTNEKLDSIRNLALSYNVNPNTIVRALEQLENEGLIYTDRTNGKFVTEDENLIEKFRNELLRNKTLEYIYDIRRANVNLEDTINLINELWRYEDE